MINFTYLVHEKSEINARFSYKLCLMVVDERDLILIATILGLDVDSTASKTDIMNQINTYVNTHPLEVLRLLNVQELNLIEELVEGGPDKQAVREPNDTLNTAKQLLLVSVYYDKKSRREYLYMIDELRELFAPHIEAVLKKTQII